MNRNFSWRKLYVAHIDEHRMISRVLKDSLEAIAPGLVIHSFSKYQHANNALHRRLLSKKRIDLVITNFKHAESEGLQLCKQLHDEELKDNRSHIPVMLLTLDSFNDSELLPLFREHIIDKCLSKADNVEFILSWIRALVCGQAVQPAVSCV